MAAPCGTRSWTRSARGASLAPASRSLCPAAVSVAPACMCCGALPCPASHVSTGYVLIFPVLSLLCAAVQMAGGMMGMGGGIPGAMPGMGMPGMGMPGAPAAAPGGFPGGFPGMPGVQLPGPPSGGGVGDPMATPIPTPYLGVNGMITADVLADDDEYKEVGGSWRLLGIGVLMRKPLSVCTVGLICKASGLYACTQHA